MVFVGHYDIIAKIRLYGMFTEISDPELCAF